MRVILGGAAFVVGENGGGADGAHAPGIAVGPAQGLEARVEPAAVRGRIHASGPIVKRFLRFLPKHTDCVVPPATLPVMTPGEIRPAVRRRNGNQLTEALRGLGVPRISTPDIGMACCSIFLL